MISDSKSKYLLLASFLGATTIKGDTHLDWHNAPWLPVPVRILNTGLPAHISRVFTLRYSCSILTQVCGLLMTHGYVDLCTTFGMSIDIHIGKLKNAIERMSYAAANQSARKEVMAIKAIYEEVGIPTRYDSYIPNRRETEFKKQQDKYRQRYHNRKR